MGPQHRLGGDHDERPLRARPAPGSAAGGSTAPTWTGSVTRRLPRARQRQEPLEARRGVLGALALVAVRQQQDQAGELAPLVLGRHQEVVDDDLGAVGEVAELGLPGHQGLGRLDRVAVLEADGGVLGEQGVADGEVAHRPRRLQRVGADAVQAVADVGQRDVLLAVGVVDQDGVAVAEGAAAGVLAGQAHVDALVHERADGQRLGQGPVDLAARPPARRAGRTGAPAWGGS